MLKRPQLVRSARTFALAAALSSLALPGGAETLSLKIDPDHTNVSFKVRHLFTQVTGLFRQFQGTILLDEKSLAASSVEVTIQVASVDTNVEDRDKDLRSPRFFDVAKHPTMTFKSTAVTDVSGSRARIKGMLTMHGISKEVVLDAEYLGKLKDPYGNLKYGFHAETKINRKDFGLNWNEVLESGGILVGEEVQINLDAEALPVS